MFALSVAGIVICRFIYVVRRPEALDSPPRHPVAYSIRAVGLLLMTGGRGHRAIAIHCDPGWNVLGTSGTKTVDEAKKDAERNYPGVASRRIDAGTSIEEALEYYDDQTGGQKCSFCKKRPFEVEGWMKQRQLSFAEDASACPRTCRSKASRTAPVGRFTGLCFPVHNIVATPRSILSPVHSFV